MFQQLFKLCFVTNLLATRSGSAAIVIAKDVVGMTTNLSDTVTCETWKFEETDVTLPLLVEESSSGIYKCSTSEDVVLFIAYEIMTFVFVSDPAIYQEKVSLNCYARFWPKNFAMTSTLTIFDQNKNKLKDFEMRDIPKGAACENECVFDMETDKAGEFPHSCDWNITIEHEGTTYKDGMTFSRNLRVYMPVNNVRVNRTETKMYEVVECYADGFPEPTHFQWTCRSGSDITGKGWATQGHRISFVRAREYKCTCTAFNSGVAEVHSSEWSGVILVHPSEEEEEEEDDEGPSNDETVNEGDTGKSNEDSKAVTKNNTGGKKKGKKKDRDKKVNPDKKSPVASGLPSNHETLDPFVHYMTFLIFLGTSKLIV